MIKKYLFPIAAVSIFLIGSSVAGWTQERQIVLLKNGESVAGDVTLHPGELEIKLPSGSKFRISMNAVDLLGDNQLDIYQQWTQRLRPDDANDHVRIAKWCLSVGLFEQAKIHVEEVVRIRDTHPDIPFLKKRIQHLEMTEASIKQAQDSVPKMQSPVENAQPASNPSTSANETSQTNEVDLSEAELAKLPKWTDLSRAEFAEYLDKIQPRILSGCSAAHCHGPVGTTRFQLARLNLGAAPTKTMSQSNFNTMMRFVDFDDISNSDLVKFASTKHGSLTRPVFPAGGDSYKLLVNWLEAVSDNQESGGVNPIQRTSANLSAQGGNGSAVKSTFIETTGSPVAEKNPYDPLQFNRKMHPELFSEPSLPEAGESALPTDSVVVPGRIIEPKRAASPPIPAAGGSLPSSIPTPPRN